MSDAPLKIVIFGGTGLLGTHVAREALAAGHSVTLVSRGASVPQSPLNGDFRRVAGDVGAMGPEALAAVCADHDAAVYALGIDDRELHPRPAYAAFHHDHVTVCLKAAHAARQAGVKKFVVLGSYFTHFDTRLPQLQLAQKHVYIRTRCEQRDAVLQAAGPGFDTFVLELPYILGHLPGRVPPWAFLFSMLDTKGAGAWFFTQGGTAAVTARQVGQAALSACQGGVATGAYPLGGCNLAWTDFADAFFRVTQNPKRLRGLPRPLFQTFGVLSNAVEFVQGKQRGLSLSAFAEVQYTQAFIDPEPSMASLGYPHDDYGSALRELIVEWRRQPTR